MSNPLYHKIDPDSQGLSKPVHPSLVPYLLNITINSLTATDALCIVTDNAEHVLSDFVRNARKKGVLR